MIKISTSVACAAVVFCAGCPRPQTLVVFHASSLARALDRVARAFGAERPDVRLALEPSGSLVAARKITELGRRADLVLLADERIIEQDLEPMHVRFSLRFASNRLVLAYGPHSRGAQGLTLDSWPAVLVSQKVRLGCARIDTAPIGYRTRWLWQLAARHHAIKNLAIQLQARCVNDLIANDEGQLLGLLTSGSVDYVFMYHSTVVEHHLQSLNLPAAIDLRNGGTTTQIKGAHSLARPIIYALSIPEHAPLPLLAEDLVLWMLSDAGRAVLQRSGFELMQAPVVDNMAALPSRLRRAVSLKQAP